MMSETLEDTANQFILAFNAFSVDFYKEHGAVSEGCHFIKTSGALVEQLWQANSECDVRNAALALRTYAGLLRKYDSFRRAEISTKEGFFPNYDFSPKKYVAHSHALLTGPQEF
jgi:hypothetical protein